MTNSLNRLKEFKSKYEHYIPAAFFVLGFLFDIITLSRIDDPLSIVQQAIYILFIIFILRKKLLFDENLWKPHAKLEKLWSYHNEALHFILGSLLSIYALFFFLSASLATSFGFLAIMFILLLVNELPQFQSKGLAFKYALLAICLFSFFASLIPMVLGFIGIIPFTISLLMVGLILWLNYNDLRKTPNITSNLKKIILTPGIAVISVIAVLYIARILPPIPLSIQYIGIYHSIEKVRPQGQEGPVEFQLRYDRPFWKFWQSGAQDFVSYEGDRIYCFVRIFSPANFKDKIVYHWLKHGPRGWETQDRITNEITGGRDEGYRAFVYKTNFEAGDWRVQVETEDGREIGRIQFEVTKNVMPAPAEREMRLDVH